MPQPKLDPAIVSSLCSMIAAFIAEERDRYRPTAMPLDAGLRRPLASFFHPEVLDHTLFSPARQPLRNPSFYSQLQSMGIHGLVDFSAVAAITYQSVIVHQESLTPRLAFHELVHAEQYL